MKVVSTRSHPADLPSTEEIRDMMAREAQRKTATGKHFPDFSAAERWLTALEIESGLFRDTNTLDEVSGEADWVKRMVVEKTLEQKPTTELEEVERYLGEEDQLENADLAIVFGGKTLARAEKGAEVYLEGWVKRLVMTGKGPNYKGIFDRPEAEVFKDKAIELGVREENILVETESINIPSNVRGTLNLLDQRKISYKSIMAIISWYAQRRAWVTLKKYLPNDVKIIRVNADLPLEGDKPNGYEKGEWNKTGEGIEIVFNEFVKMRHQVVTDTA